MEVIKMLNVDMSLMFALCYFSTANKGKSES